MTKLMRKFLQHRGGSVAIEAAIFLPIFMVLTFGITDLGLQMYLRQQVNAAVQAGAAYAIIHASDCLSSSGCSGQLYSAMDDASGNSSFCSSAATCNFPPPAGCTDGIGICFTVSANYALNPILPSSTYSWATPMTISYTVVVRVPVTS